METNETTFKIPKLSIKNTFEEINIIAIPYAMSIFVHKRRIVNNEALPIDTQIP
jgi:hypothetical protein